MISVGHLGAATAGAAASAGARHASASRSSTHGASSVNAPHSRSAGRPIALQDGASAARFAPGSPPEGTLFYRAADDRRGSAGTCSTPRPTSYASEEPPATSSGGSSRTSTSSPPCSCRRCSSTSSTRPSSTSPCARSARTSRPRPSSGSCSGYTLSLAVWIPASGLDRRPLRHQAVFLVRAGALRRRLGLCGARPDDRSARRLPGPAGRRRRDAHADRHRHAVPGLPADRAGPGLDDRDDPDAGRAGPRPGARRRSSPTRSAGAGSSTSTSRSASSPSSFGLRLPARAHRADGRPVRHRRVRAVGRRAGVDRLRHQRGPVRRLDRSRGWSGWGSSGRWRSPLLVYVETHRRTRCSRCACSSCGCSGRPTS